MDNFEDSKIINERTPARASVLYVLVTCTKDRSRYELLQRVQENLEGQAKRYPIAHSLLVFDNDSDYPGSEELLSRFPLIAKSAENVGYWSAIQWCLDNYKSLLLREFEYIYVIESDLLHYDFERIGLAISYLESEPAVATVRLQNFKVRWPLFYSKSTWRFLRSPDAVTMLNQITKEKIRFWKSKISSVYNSNFPPKVCALHRMAELKRVFSQLRQLDSFAEGDFFRIGIGMHQVTGVLDGGIFTAKLGYDPSGKSVQTGSWSADAGGAYLSTRTSAKSIRDLSAPVTIIRPKKHRFENA